MPGRRGIQGRAVGAYVPKLTRKAFEKYGFSTATLLTDWAIIVGADIAGYTAPERLKWPRGVEGATMSARREAGRPGATLMLRVEPARALDVQYKARQLIERINAYFGYRAVAEMRLVQAPLIKSRRRSGRKRAALRRPARPRAAVQRRRRAAARRACQRSKPGMMGRERKPPSGHRHGPITLPSLGIAGRFAVLHASSRATCA